MIRIAVSLFALVWLGLASGCSPRGSSAAGDGELCAVMEERIARYIADKDARIGVAVIIDGTDTVAVNGSRDFPMMSVFKFPLALVIAEGAGKLTDSVAIGADELHENTYSPMLRKYGRRDMTLPLRELLEWALAESDNNACDILIGCAGGIDSLSLAMTRMGVPEGIAVGATEAQMHDDVYLCYLNRSTPLAMAELFDRFDSSIRHSSASFAEVASILENCRTGLDRLPAPLAGSGAVIGHKTGTGDVNSQGRIMAINDCGYVHLPSGRRYSIAVFIADSAYDMGATSKMIAEISEIVYKSLEGNG